ncbi:MAG: hypothetical protein KDB00_02695 [Planctomycetales bacterium]|nr:hypothetical protein [Planctomycetales bacterium]
MFSPSRIRWSKLAIATVLAGCVFSMANCDEPKQSGFLRLHPDNPRYLQWRDATTLLVTSGEHYGALLNLDFDYIRYFDELQRHGLNHTRIFSGVYREDPSAFNITENTLAPDESRYISPWMRSDEIAKNGTAKFDLGRWNPAYFQRLADLLKQAEQRGIVVEFTLFCPMYNDKMWEISPMNAINNTQGIGRCGREQVYNLSQHDLTDVQIAVTKKIVEELRNAGNLYYEVCNEPYFGGVTMDWQTKIINTIVDTEKDFPRKHLISLNIANGRKEVNSPHPAVSIFNFHYCVPPDTVAINAGLNKVIGENETGFRGSADVLYRTEGWDFMLAGGGLYNNLDYSFSCRHPDGSLGQYKSPGGGSVQLREQLGVMKKFLDGFDLISMRPDTSVIRSTSPKLTHGVLANPGHEYALYFHTPISNKPKDLQKELRARGVAEIEVNLPAASYRFKWIDPVGGETLLETTIGHSGGELQISTPAFENDIALEVRVLR